MSGTVREGSCLLICYSKGIFGFENFIMGYRSFYGWKKYWYGRVDSRRNYVKLGRRF